MPFYYLATWLRNLCYDNGFCSSKSYDISVICVGNLSVGGTGKTPMIEYLIRLLSNDHNVATLSRGYGRVTKGYVLADKDANANSIGDEPFQFYSKFNKLTVAVDGNRQRGISNLLQLDPQPEVILLDDAFQHRKVKAGFNILLTTYDNLYVDDVILPTGNLREPRSGAKRADVIIVTKCPGTLADAKQQRIIKKLNPNPNQYVFFSSISYSESIYNEKGEHALKTLKDAPFTLVTGIANAKPLVDHLHSEGLSFEHLNFKDHHNFTKSDIESLRKKGRILVTEKDYMRLKDVLDGDDLWYLPIEIEISNGNYLNQILKDHLTH